MPEIKQTGNEITWHWFHSSKRILTLITCSAAHLQVKYELIIDLTESRKDVKVRTFLPSDYNNICLFSWCGIFFKFSSFCGGNFYLIVRVFHQEEGFFLLLYFCFHIRKVNYYLHGCKCLGRASKPPERRL